MAVAALVAASILGAAVAGHGPPGTSALPAGRWVTVRPRLGYAPAPIRTYLTNTELEVVSRIQRMVDGLRTSTRSPVESGAADWRVEQSALFSPTFALQRDVLIALDRTLERQVETTRDWPLSIVVARSQDFIRRTTARLGCVPNLARTNGVVLMGAAVCSRHVMISNVTGFLWLVRADQRISRTLERRKEPPLARIPYRIVMRNSSGLAHEFVHIWRAASVKGQVRSDEPAWFAEGFAEFWSSIAILLAFPGQIPYRTQHIVRLRDFVGWPSMCPHPLAYYRVVSSLANGCEYHVGLAAVEYLYSKYSSLEKTIDAFSRAGEYGTFAEGFEATFGISVSEFEKEADVYIQNLRRADAAGRVVRSRN